MEITEKIVEMILSNDKELHQLVNTILGNNRKFSFTYEGNNHDITFPTRYHTASIREIIRFEILKIQLNKDLRNEG